ncbi:hypothetical protein A9Q83_05265 [Alphaproteobacteria bacterium 46_93_T64]|nr:hypothetical protein A9Q83_05265 [Alphaproteobacteria bacterium 46_93_T64]
MKDKITSTWFIVAFLLGAMFLFSFLPAHSPNLSAEPAINNLSYDNDVIDQSISKIERGETNLNAN